MVFLTLIVSSFFIHPLKTQLGDDVQSAEATTGSESLLDLQVLRPRCIKIKTFFTTIFFNNCPSELLFISTTVFGLAVSAGAAICVQRGAKLKPSSVKVGCSRSCHNRSG